ncbi:S4 domain-containing protein [Sphingomonas sp. S1-29]|uniref:RNA-binding S4 domain-containing protein n=1 Tax=Sphingomonas sp. S1-29 TaxID=2991074 RepID=UPI0022404F8D|nr:S4 domain-containing protein [Sphingomonas sp. S1-29]UZK69453.1 S4 domain-containing protein [Sphingomonas sp. S1-29]
MASMGAGAAAGAEMRLDLFLWYARFAKSRSIAQRIAEAGTLRLDGRRIERSSACVRVGSVLAFPLHGNVRVVRIEALPARRGPPAEAALHYTALDLASPKGVDVQHGAA